MEIITYKAVLDVHYMDPQPIVGIRCDNNRKAWHLAKQWARENPDKKGYIVVDNAATGGYNFYEIDKGVSTTSAACWVLPETYKE